MANGDDRRWAQLAELYEEVGNLTKMVQAIHAAMLGDISGEPPGHLAMIRENANITAKTVEKLRETTELAAQLSLRLLPLERIWSIRSMLLWGLLGVITVVALVGGIAGGVIVVLMLGGG